MVTECIEISWNDFIKSTMASLTENNDCSCESRKKKALYFIISELNFSSDPDSPLRGNHKEDQNTFIITTQDKEVLDTFLKESTIAHLIKFFKVFEKTSNDNRLNMLANQLSYVNSVNKFLFDEIIDKCLQNHKIDYEEAQELQKIFQDNFLRSLVQHTNLKDLPVTKEHHKEMLGGVFNASDSKYRKIKEELVKNLAFIFTLSKDCKKDFNQTIIDLRDQKSNKNFFEAYEDVQEERRKAQEENGSPIDFGANLKLGGGKRRTTKGIGRRSGLFNFKGNGTDGKPQRRRSAKVIDFLGSPPKSPKREGTAVAPNLKSLGEAPPAPPFSPRHRSEVSAQAPGQSAIQSPRRKGG